MHILRAMQRSQLTGVALRTLVLLATVLATSVQWAGQASANGIPAPAAQEALGRRFYLTPDSAYNGATALTACDAGFHMASIWEIADVTNLVYDTSRGYTGADSGLGPPSYVMGWVRTGYYEASGANTPGIGNCQLWTSSSASDYGSRAFLSADWLNDPRIDGTEWTYSMFTCNTTRRVWCVENYNPAWNVGSYYLTTSTYDGAEMLSACTNGYHVASIWEIVDPSRLIYDTTLGYTQADAGYGPPTYPWAYGWVRTGNWAADVGTIPGVANCNGWSSDSASAYGTFIDLRSDWTVTRDIGVWKAFAGACNIDRRVWCVRQPLRLYLPLVLRDS